MTQPSSEVLAAEIDKIGLTDLAKRARQDEFHDYQSPHTYPQHVLVDELQNAGLTAARRLIRRVINGEFDATRAEGDAWAASPEGKATIKSLSATRFPDFDLQ